MPLAINNQESVPSQVAEASSILLSEDTRETVASPQPTRKAVEKRQSRLAKEIAQTRQEIQRMALSVRKRSTGDNAEARVNGLAEHPLQEDKPIDSKSRSRSKSTTRRSVTANSEKVYPKDRSRDSSVRGRSTSSQRPQTGSSNFEVLTSSVESVKKRLSLLRMGRKSSKVSVRVDSLQEE